MDDSRVICYSFAGTIFTVIVAAVSAESLYAFLALFPLCLFALFLCAVFEMAVMRVIRGKWVIAVFSAVWIFASILLPFSFGEKWETLLRGVPLAVSLVLAIASIFAFGYQISKMLPGGQKYAAA